MDQKELKTRLETLYDDLVITNRETTELLSFISKSGDERRKMLDDMYFKDNAPVKVLGTEFLGRKEADITGEMIALSSKYDEFIDRLHKEAYGMMARHNEAVDIFYMILSLPEPYCKILYLRYFRRLSCKETMSCLYQSRTTFFRNLNKAIELLLRDLDAGSAVTVAAN